MASGNQHPVTGRDPGGIAFVTDLNAYPINEGLEKDSQVPLGFTVRQSEIVSLVIGMRRNSLKSVATTWITLLLLDC